MRSSESGPAPGPPRPASRISARLPSLDGWRAMSILMVLGAHCKFTAGFPSALTTPFLWLFDGDLGVRMFFVISGFLITWLMLVEHDRCGRVSLTAFYARRALRILPVYCAFLLALALLQWRTPFSQSAVGWLGDLTFTANFMDIGFTKFTSEHLWSLSTEEQFYLLWPGLFVLGAIATHQRHAWRFLAVPVLVAPVCRVMGYTSTPLFLYPVTRHFSFFSYFDSLAIGCAAAILLSRRRELVGKYLEQRPRKALTVALILMLTPYVFMKLHWLRQVTVPFAYTSQAFGFSALLLLSILFPQRGAFRVLNWGWVCRIGVLSYSIYIWQQIFCSPPESFGLGAVWWMSFPGWLVPAFAAGFISYYGFEKPFLKLRARWRKA